MENNIILKELNDFLYSYIGIDHTEFYQYQGFVFSSFLFENYLGK